MVHMFVAVTLDQLLKQENIVLEFWTTRKRRIDQCQQYVVLETSAKQVLSHTRPFYGPFSGTTRVSRCQKRTYGLYGVRED